MNSEKIKYRNKWYYVDSEDLEEPTITKLFLYDDPDLTEPVKNSKGTLMVRKMDIIDQLKEYVGAGFSYGGGSSIFPVNRGGQMNRGGFGGASNLGGANMMYTYEIKPLTRNLQPKPTDFEIEEKIHDGHFIEGQELNKKDGKIHKGTVLRTEKNEDHDPMFYIILCDETGMKIKIDPTTATLLGGEHYIDPENGVQNISNDQAEIMRAGKVQETMKAKSIKDTLNESEHLSAAKWNRAQEYLIKYGYDPEEAYFLLQDLSMENYGLGNLSARQIAEEAIKWDEESKEGIDESLNEYSIWDRERDNLKELLNVKPSPKFDEEDGAYAYQYNKPLFDWLRKILKKHNEKDSIELVTAIFSKIPNKLQWDGTLEDQMKWVYQKFDKFKMIKMDLLKDLFKRFEELRDQSHRL